MFPLFFLPRSAGAGAKNGERETGGGSCLQGKKIQFGDVSCDVIGVTGAFESDGREFEVLKTSGGVSPILQGRQ